MSDGAPQPLDADAARCPACGATRPRGGWPLHPHLGRLVGGRHRLYPAVSGCTLAGCVEAHLREPPPRLPSAAPAAPRGLEQLVFRV